MRDGENTGEKKGERLRVGSHHSAHSGHLVTVMRPCSYRLRKTINQIYVHVK